MMRGSSAWILVTLLVLVFAGPARAAPEKCRTTILEASSAFVQAEARVLRKCREQIVRGKLPAATNCLAHLPTAKALARAGEKLRTRITKACGGKDHACGTGDDDPLASIGWDIGTCSALTGGSCAAPVSSCADIATCVECIGDTAVEQALELAYGEFLPAENPVRRCQIAIGRSIERFLVTRSKALSRCWRGVSQGKIAGPCPAPGDGKAEDALARAEQRKVADICRACGGSDRECGGGDDLALGEIGFAAMCPTASNCSAPLGILADAVGCLDCIAELESDCADRNAVPGLAPYPSSCDSAVPPPPPTLNYSLPPNYGSTSLTSGFVPDPYTVGVTGGGPVDVGYLGGGCTGHATSAPDFSVNYTAGAFPTLRFYFIGINDSTMVINTPSGSYVCVDDSFGTLNPTIDFNSPSSGRYDVWIGSYADGIFVSGTLYVTENTGNHP
jgi:hypothetical protein